jgi:hypothetical protein
LQDAVSSRNELTLKVFRLLRLGKSGIKFAGHFCGTKKAAAKKIQGRFVTKKHGSKRSGPAGLKRLFQKIFCRLM